MIFGGGARPNASKIISKNDVAGGSQVKGLQNNCLLIGAYIGLRGRRRNAGHWTHRILQRFVDLRAGAAELESEPRPREVGAGAGVGARTAEPEQPELGEARARAGARVLEAAWRLTDRRVNQVFQKAANQFWQPSAKRFQQQAANQFWMQAAKASSSKMPTSSRGRPPTRQPAVSWPICQTSENYFGSLGRWWDARKLRNAATCSDYYGVPYTQ